MIPLDICIIPPVQFHPLFGQKHLLVGAVKDIRPAAYHAAEFLKQFPSLRINIKFIGMAPDIKELRPVRVKRQKPRPGFQQSVPFPMVINGALYLICLLYTSDAADD